jgi:hypothetical protein
VIVDRMIVNRAPLRSAWALRFFGAHLCCFLNRAIAQGVKLGRPKIDIATERKVRKQLAKDVGILKVAKSLGIGTGTVQRISGERAMSLRGAEQ